MAAEFATPETMAFMIRHSSGIICVPLEEQRTAALELPQMGCPTNGTAIHRFTVSVDYRHGTTTGVSAADRARDHYGMANPQTTARTSPVRHIFPLPAASRRGGCARAHIGSGRGPFACSRA